jgi:hypothetical protein
MVRKMNVDGNAQADLAGHGGEQRRLKVPISKKPPLKDVTPRRQNGREGHCGQADKLVCLFSVLFNGM